MSKITHLCKRRNQFVISHGLGVFESHGSRQPAGVAGIDVPIGCVDAGLPFHQVTIGQVAERTEVQISGVAQSKGTNALFNCFF